ncbi:MAG: 16S rRNA (guanine(966)-N(2))-methyltransferase RsmD [Rickettsiales bacterium]|nr:16S rRNA (guanine(966)-N(2))-methyltransferase RsmD [Rickettsiales bacterium]|tara:strand:+ start:10048 stop:10632 length:585 start_codon:yes stop_codon:yes gene_type:complete
MINMRIVGGKFRGKSLKWTSESTTRPTKDNVREALFNVLENSLKFNINSARVMDLFAGTGSLVMESISRGAGAATLIETNYKVRKTLWENIKSLGVEEICQVVGLKAQTYLERGNPEGPYDLIFLDPPYRITYWSTLLNKITSSDWLQSDGLIVVETSKTTELKHPGFMELFNRTYGIVKIMILKRECNNENQA